MEKIRAIVEGIYTLTEWIDGGVSLDSSSFMARMTIQDGAMIFTANNYQPEKKINMTGMGAYVLTQDTFAYGYQQFVIAVTDEQGDKIDRSMPAWASDMALPNMREFTLQLSGDTVTLANKGGIFEMNPNGFVYTDLNTHNIRVWKKHQPATL